MPQDFSLVCSRCGQAYGVDEAILCSRCGGVLFTQYDQPPIPPSFAQKRGVGVWRYAELLPIKDSSRAITLGEGGTQLHLCNRLSDRIGLRHLWVKDETKNPTGSFLDRGVSVEISWAVEKGYREVCCASSGNLGASAAAYAARAGLLARVFVPSDVDVGKLCQIIAYGAELEVAKTHREAHELAESCAKASWRRLLTPANPFFLEGIKTVAYEICESLGWRYPDWVAAPMGNGGLISMIWRGFCEFKELGLVRDEPPKLIGVQAQGCAPIVEAYDRGLEEALPTQGIAYPLDIAVENPLEGYLALRSIRESGGGAVAVSQKEMLEAVAELARLEGIFAEPAAASVVAAVRKLVEDGAVERGEEVVLVVTGSGLKDPEAVRKIPLSSKALKRLFAKKGFAPLTLGETKRAVLRVLGESGPIHGYGVWKALLHRFSIKLSIPTLYQHLQELEEMGLVRRLPPAKVGGRVRVYYELTQRGAEALG